MFRGAPQNTRRTIIDAFVSQKALYWCKSKRLDGYELPPPSCNMQSENTGWQTIMALDPKLFDELTRKLTGVLPESARELQEDLEKNARALLSTTLDKMDLVTREEFDVQKAVLARTRAKLETLEKQVAELEQALSTSGPVRS